MTGFQSKKAMSQGDYARDSWEREKQSKQYQIFLDEIYSRPRIENLFAGDGTVYGMKYHTVQPVGGDWRKMEKWCNQTYGTTPKDGVWTPNARWYMNNRKFWFREEKDLTMFILRWR